jgi:hypothetical protein
MAAWGSANVTRDIASSRRYRRGILIVAIGKPLLSHGRHRRHPASVA